MNETIDNADQENQVTEQEDFVLDDKDENQEAAQPPAEDGNSTETEEKLDAETQKQANYAFIKEKKKRQELRKSLQEKDDEIQRLQAKYRWQTEIHPDRIQERVIASAVP